MVCFEEIGQKFNRMRMIWQVFSLSDGHRGNSEKPSETGKLNLKNENMLKKNLKRLRAHANFLGVQVEWRAFLVRRSRRWPGLRDPRHHYQMVTFPMTLTIIIHKDIQGIIMVLFQWSFIMAVAMMTNRYHYHYHYQIIIKWSFPNYADNCNPRHHYQMVIFQWSFTMAVAMMTNTPKWWWQGSFALLQSSTNHHQPSDSN